MESIQEVYQERARGFAEALSSVKQRANLISNIRLSLAISFVVVLYFGFSEHMLLLALPAIVVLFTVLVQQHALIFKKKTQLENLVQANKAEIEIASGNLSEFDGGHAFSDPQHAYTHDLDIFGDRSIFQYLNRCFTLIGKQRLATRLREPLQSRSAIEERQQAIKEVAGDIDFRQNFQASAMAMQEQDKDRDQIRAWIKQPAFTFGKRSYELTLIILPALTILAIIGWVFHPTFRPVAIALALVQWSITGIHFKRVSLFHDYIGKKKNVLEKYAELLGHLQSRSFSATGMKKLQDKAKDASTHVQRLASLVHAFDARLNWLTAIFTNTILLYDLQCVYRLEKWKSEHQYDLDRWLEVVAETEVISSFATFSYNHPKFSFAQINDTLVVQGKELAHPLLNAKEAVYNDVLLGLDHQILIVTGANMAGKSTFLRALGVNLILAQNGAPVCASFFACPVIQLRTGMRTADSLQDHQSYFYAELNRLKGIMDELRKEIPLLILLDEILKGTNSTDKQAGSIALVKQLIPYPCLTIVATHDLALGNLADEYPNAVKNFCFEALIENDQLFFDYKLKPGLATKMNATFLMKKMGIIPS